jgi:hypothetical protein
MCVVMIKVIMIMKVVMLISKISSNVCDSDSKVMKIM